MRFTTLLIGGGLVWAIVQIANSPLARIVDRTLPSRVSLESVTTPPFLPTATTESITTGQVLSATVALAGQTPNDGVLLTTPIVTIYRAPFDGVVTAIPGGIRYQSPRLAGVIDFTGNATLPAPGPIRSGQALAMGRSVQLMRRNTQGSVIAPERSLIEALQVGAQ